MHQNPGQSHAFGSPSAVTFDSYPDPPRATAGKRTSRLGMAALLLGLFALLVGWVPVLGLIGLIPAALGLAMAVLAVVLATVSRGDGLSAPRTGRKLPVAAAGICLLGGVLSPVSTIVGVAVVAPYAWQVGMDNLEIEWRHELMRANVAEESADRISVALVEALRPLGDVSQGPELADRWREAVATLNRLEQAREDYRVGLRRELMAAPELADPAPEAAARFERDVRALVQRAGIDLPSEDVGVLVEFLRRDVTREVQNWLKWQQRWERNACPDVSIEPVLFSPGPCPVPSRAGRCGVTAGA